ncbi:MAG TPA: tetratricopeptide repeat protein [Polyangiaceae bacterium]|nr:tetratricopeptide repeat protein [Polyangiaceae bacterium]
MISEAPPAAATPAAKAAPTSSPKAAPTSSPKAAPSSSPNAAPSSSPKAAPVASPKAAPGASASHAPVPVAVSELSQASRAAVIKTLSFGTHEETASDAPTLLKASLPGDKNQASVTRVQNAKELILACQRELEQKPAPAPQRAGRLHFEIARLQDSSLGDLTGAAEHYQTAHRLMPDHLPSILGARRALLQAGQFAAALPLYDAELRATSNAAKKALVSLEKARILDEKLGLKREAREAYEVALELDETNPSALRAVERAELAAKAWDALEKTYQRAAQVLTSDGRHRAAVLSERARLFEAHKRDNHTATELYQAAFEADPGSPSAILALKRLHSAHQRHHDLIAVLEREAVLSADPAVRALSLYRVARLYADRIGNLEAAAEALERALSQVADEAMILEELARVYELSKRHADLVRILERIADRLDAPTERVGVYHRIAQIYEDKLGESARAIEWYERALSAERGYVPAIQALAKLYTRGQHWQELVRVHTGEAEATNDPARRAAAYSRIAQIYETELKLVDQAVQHHARALGVLPGYAPSFKALTRLYAQARRFPELAELYERAVDGAADDEAKITYLFKVGRLYEDALEAPAQALTAYRRILDVDPQHLGAIHALQRAAERAGRFKDLVQALELEAQKIPDKRQRLSILHRAGEVSEVELGDDDAALALFRKIYDLDRTYAPALASLGRLHYKAGRYEDLLETYQAELRISGKNPQSAALMFKMGELYEDRLGRDEEAIVSYRKAIEMDPFNHQALHALGRKLTERNRFDEFVKLLELELSSLKDPAQRARTSFRLGEVYEYRLKSPEKALSAYEAALAAEPDFRPARDGRLRLLTEARDFKRLVDELAREAQTAKDPKLAVAALLREGEVWRDELGDPVRAISCFEAVLHKDPGHVDALLALEPLYAERGTWDLLCQVLSSEARVFNDPAARVGALRELGRVQEEFAGASPEQVQNSYFAILQLLPTDLAALRALEQRALREGDKKLLSHIDAKLGAMVEEPQLVALYHARLAEALEELGDGSALEMFRSALRHDPESIAAARGLSRIAERGQIPELLEEAAESEARMGLDPSVPARLLLKAASCRTERGDVAGAIQSLTRALEINPEHEAAAARVHELLLARGEVDRLITLLTQSATSAKKAERVASIWVAVAELYADKKNDIPAGLAALQRAKNLLPGHVPTLMKLAELYTRDGQWAEAVERLSQVIGLGPAEDVLVDAHVRLAAVLDEHLHDAARALSNLNAALARDPNHRPALGRLLSLQRRQNQLDHAVETARRLVKVSPERNARVLALVEVGRLERSRGQGAAAIQAYEQAVALVGVDGAAAAEFRELVASERKGPVNYSRYVAALSRFTEDAPTSSAALIPTYLEMSRVLSDEMGELDQAVQTLTRGLNKVGERVELQAELSTRLLRAGQFAPAIAAARRVLETDVMRPSAWRELSEGFKGLGRISEATLALAPLLAINAANDLERATLSARASRAGSGHPGSFDLSQLQAISALPPDDAATGLLAQVAEGLGKIYPPELERYGVNPRDRINAKSGHPLRALADRVASVFGVEEFDLYLHRASGTLIDLEFSDPVAILVPGGFAKLSEGQQVFLLARVMANVSRSLQAIDKLPAEALSVLLAAAARTVDSSFAAGLTDEEYLNNQARRVSRSLPWLGRGAVEEAARAYIAAPRLEPTEWLFRARLGALRAALILADDLPGSIGLVRQTEGDLAGLTGAALAQGMRSVHDLMRFWVSDPALLARRKLGTL